MAVPADLHQIEEAERQLGRTLPRALRERLMRHNGGEIRVAGYADAEP